MPFSWFWTAPQQPKAYDLYLDWDGTITRRDTLSMLAGIGYRNHERAGSKPPLPPWSSFSTAWVDDYTAHEDAYEPSREARTTASQEFDWLRSLKTIEERSITRVEAAGVFKDLDRQIVDADVDVIVKESLGVDEQQLEPTAVSESKLTLRAGLFPLMQKIQKQNGKNRIISVNWSSFFISSCLRHVGSRTGELEAISGLEIAANEIDGLQNENDDDISRERTKKIWRDFSHVHKGLWTSEHKASILRALRDLDNEDGRSPNPFIYVGDSPTDLECLLLADIGIVVRNDPYEGSQLEMMETLKRIHIDVKWIGEFKSNDNSVPKEKVLWWAKDFTEILNSQVLSG